MSTTPDGNGLDSIRRRFTRCPSGKSCLPLPSTTGYTNRLYSSTRSCSARVCTSTLLPSIMMFLPGFAFRVRISWTTLLLTKVELRQAEAVGRVVETTYFGVLFMASPKGSPAGIGSNAPPWICQVLRPRSSASVRPISSKKCAPMSSCQYGPVHPPWVKPPSVSSSAPPGACMTLSNDTNSETTMFRMISSISSNHPGFHPLYKQLHERLRRGILSGQLECGMRLPSTRQLISSPCESLSLPAPRPEGHGSSPWAHWSTAHEDAVRDHGCLDYDHSAPRGLQSATGGREAGRRAKRRIMVART